MAAGGLYSHIRLLDWDGEGDFHEDERIVHTRVRFMELYFVP